MTTRLLETVPNFSEGRDRDVVLAIVGSMEAAGADVLDWHMDADHDRSVVTAVGTPDVIEAAAVAAARMARDRIDMKRHRGVHPRIGALDVLPIVPLMGIDMADARVLARRVADRIVREVEVPIFYYGQAADPPGRGLAELRRGGFEALATGWPEDRQPDGLPDSWPYPGAHPTAGATCVGARGVLLAWNVWCDGVDLATARAVARSVRERNGGLPGVRALAFDLPGRGVQISMNLENPETVSPLDVFEAVEAGLAAAGGRVAQTEVIGLVPDTLVTSAAASRLRLKAGTTERLMSHCLLQHVAGRFPARAQRGE